MVNNKLIVITAVALVGGSFFLYLMNTSGDIESLASQVEVLEQPRPVATVTVPAAIASAEVEIAIEQTQPAVIETELFDNPQSVTPEDISEPMAVIDPLPPLNSSDNFVRSKISGFAAGPDLISLLVSDQLIRRLVLFTDSVSRQSLSRDIPLSPMTQVLQTKPGVDDEHFILAPTSYQRFDFLVGILIAIDTDDSVSFYRQLSPLLQEAYAEIGYPNQHFDDAMLTAIDNVLSATRAEGPFELIRPSVMYRYADAELETLSEVNKLLLRLGPDNAEKLKRKLSDFKSSFLAQ